MKFNSFNILLVLVLLIKAFVASKEITKLDSTSNNIMNNGDFFYGKNEKNNAEFVLGLYEIAFTLMYYILGHQDIKYLSPLSQNPDTYILSGNVKYGKLGDDAVFRVYNTDGKEIYKIGEECSVLGQSTMTFESTDAYLNDDEYAVKNVPLTYGVVITNALGEKYYFPPRKTETETETEPVPPIDHMEWIKWDGTIPDEAVSIKNTNGKTFLVGRIKYNYGYRCGYVDLDKKQLDIPSGTISVGYHDGIEILVGPSDHFYWKKVNKNTKLRDGHHIVVGGSDENGNELGIAKCNYDDNYFIGELNLNKLDHAVYFNQDSKYNSLEYNSYNYEVLIYSDESIKQLEWKKWDGTIPSDAVYINNNPNGKSYVVGRINYKNGIHCGYVDVDSKKLTISYGNNELIYDDNFEILTGSSNLFEWKKINLDNKSNYSNQIVIGGNESNGDKLGVAKCKYKNNYYFGKVNLNYLHHSNFGINNVEIECSDFEVLIYKGTQVEGEQVSSVEKMEWINWNGRIPNGAVFIKDNPNGKTFIVGRTSYKNGIHCGYVDVTTSDMKLIITYGGHLFEYSKNFEVLIGPSDHFSWKKINLNNKSDYSNQIVIGGNESNGDKLGVAKCKNENNYYLGKVNLNELDHANYALDGYEINSRDYEVLIYSE